MHLPDGLHRPFQVFLTDDARKMQYLLRGSLLLSFVIAMHTGYFLGASKEDGRSTTWASTLAATIAEAMGGLYFAFTLLWLSLTACIKVPLSAQAEGDQSDTATRPWKHAGLAVINFFRDPSMAWRFVLLLCSGMATFTEHHWLFSFLVLDFFCQNAALATVLKGIMQPMRSLMMTFLGSAIVTFAYAAVGFHFFRGEFGEYCAESVMSCTTNIIYGSTRSGIVGLSSLMKPVLPDDQDFAFRMLYDVSFFVIFGIMLLNTIVALIVDSFSSQRRQLEARETNRQSETFISCLDRKLIEQAAQAQGISDGFKWHETHRQPKWGYMAFVFYLREKDAQDYTGPEQVIRGYVSQDDVKWMPLGRSKLLEDTELSLQDDGIQRLEKQAKHLIADVSGGTRVKHTLVQAVGSINRTFDERFETIGAQVLEMQTQLTNALTAKANLGDGEGRGAMLKSTTVERVMNIQDS